MDVRDDAHQLTVALLDLVRALVEIEDGPSTELLPELIEPGKATLHDVLIVLLKAQVASIPQDTSDEKMLRGRARRKPYRKPPTSDVLHPEHLQLEAPLRLESVPGVPRLLPTSISPYTEIIGGILAKRAAAGMPVDELLQDLENWVRQVRDIAKAGLPS